MRPLIEQANDLRRVASALEARGDAGGGMKGGRVATLRIAARVLDDLDLLENSNPSSEGRGGAGISNSGSEQSYEARSPRRRTSGA